MSIKKSLLALAAAALASMAFASSALASGGVVRDVEAPNIIIPAGTKIVYQGWAKFAGIGSYECHVEAETEAEGATGTTAKVLRFTVPVTSKCTGTTPFAGCVLATHTLDGTSPKVTATAGDFDVTGLKLTNTYTGCSTTSATLDFTSDAASFLTLKPLNTKNIHTATGTQGTIGDTAATGVNAEPISGVEVEGKGTATTEQHIIFVATHLKEQNVTATGELEITGANRCTWKLANS